MQRVKLIDYNLYHLYIAYFYLLKNVTHLDSNQGKNSYLWDPKLAKGH